MSCCFICLCLHACKVEACVYIYICVSLQLTLGQQIDVYDVTADERTRCELLGTQQMLHCSHGSELKQLLSSLWHMEQCRKSDDPAFTLLDSMSVSLRYTQCSS